MVKDGNWYHLYADQHCLNTLIYIGICQCIARLKSVGRSQDPEDDLHSIISQISDLMVTSTYLFDESQTNDELESKKLGHRLVISKFMLQLHIELQYSHHCQNERYSADHAQLITLSEIFHIFQ